MTIALDEGTGPEEPAWTGFVLLVVPVEGLELAADGLVQAVRDRVAADVVLADTVRVAGGPAIGTAGYEETSAVANALVRAALVNRREAFAPRVVFGCVLVGQEPERAEQLAAELSQSQELSALPLHCYGVGASSPAGTVTEVTARIVVMMDSVERWPDAVIDERRLLSLLRPSPADPPIVPPTVAPLATGGGKAGEDPEPRSRWRGLLARGRRANPTPAQALDRLARTTNAAALAYLVLVTDGQLPERRVRDRQARLAVELDGALARLRVDWEGDGLAPVETALFTAGRTLVRHGPLRPAGQLSRVRLPKVKPEYVDLVRCVNGIGNAHQRDLNSLTSRGVEVPATVVVLISTCAPLADSESVEWLRVLGDRCRVVWILVGVDPELMSDEFTEAGVLVLDDHSDIAHEFTERISGQVE
ncbi:hypothetical protein [Verrucosispora sp. NA02020]|uniref:hypothetical protein n=1 Tax=Verrucosispora sp. NA02020 TaxID=2742132 RepID=UPI001591FE0B|nr:hypothetical protein [Verrucosispora sp. NA02020]QKW12234.1 hypothetical protein HUT12_05115 [Verrucosispora sp. NA02020]